MNSTHKKSEINVYSNCWDLDKGEKIDGDKLLKDSHSMINNDDGMPSGVSDCFAFGISYGCLCSCPVLTRGDCETIKECPEDFAGMINAEGAEYIHENEIDISYPEIVPFLFRKKT